MSDQNDNGNDEETKADLTRVEDLSEFLHQEDPEMDAIFAESDEEEEHDELPPPFDMNASLDDLEDDESDSFSDSSDDTDEEDNEFDNSFDDLTESELPDDQENTFATDDENDFQSDFEEETEVAIDYSDDETESEDETLYADGFDEQEDFSTEDNFSSSDTLDDQDNFLNDESEEVPSDMPELPGDDETSAELVSEFSEEDSDAFESELEEEVDNSFEEPENEFNEETETETIENDFIQPLEEQLSEFDNSLEEISPPPSAPRETFAEVANFANNMSYGTVKVGGNPAFSLLLRGIISEGSHDSILATLNEHGLVGEDENMIKTSLDVGHLLIPQISEYSAVYLAGKLRKYARDVQVGLAEEIHNSKSYDNDSKGLVTKRSIFQNKDLSFKRSESDFNPEDIMTTTQSKFSDAEVSQHLGIISSSGVYELSDLNEQTLEYEDELENSTLEIGSTEIYNLLLKKLKHSAFKIGANAIIGVNYTLTPIQEGELTKYNVICTGDAVITQ